MRLRLGSFASTGFVASLMNPIDALRYE